MEGWLRGMEGRETAGKEVKKGGRLKRGREESRKWSKRMLEAKETVKKKKERRITKRRKGEETK